MVWCALSRLPRHCAQLSAGPAPAPAASVRRPDSGATASACPPAASDGCGIAPSRPRRARSTATPAAPVAALGGVSQSAACICTRAGTRSAPWVRASRHPACAAACAGQCRERTQMAGPPTHPGLHGAHEVGREPKPRRADVVRADRLHARGRRGRAGGAKLCVRRAAVQGEAAPRSPRAHARGLAPAADGARVRLNVFSASVRDRGQITSQPLDGVWPLRRCPARPRARAARRGGHGGGGAAKHRPTTPN